MFRKANIVIFFLIFTHSWLIAGANPPSKEIELSPAQVNLGEVSEVTEITLTLHNRGDKPIVITKATTDCSCTKIEFSKKPILGADSTLIQIQYLPARDEQGIFYKTIYIYTSKSKEPLRGVIRGKNKE